MCDLACSLLRGAILLVLLGQKSCRTKISRIFRNFVPNFAPNFAPNFPRIFRRVFVLRFVGNGDQKKFTKNPRPFSMQNSQANSKKKSTKVFWRAGKVTFFVCMKSQGRKRHPNIKILPRIPCLNPSFSGAFNPPNSLCSGCVFSLKCRKKRRHKEFWRRGPRGAEKNLCVRFLWVFLRLFKKGSTCCMVALIKTPLCLTLGILAYWSGCPKFCSAQRFGHSTKWTCLGESMLHVGFASSSGTIKSLKEDSRRHSENFLSERLCSWRVRFVLCCLQVCPVFELGREPRQTSQLAVTSLG